MTQDEKNYLAQELGVNPNKYSTTDLRKFYYAAAIQDLLGGGGFTSPHPDPVTFQGDITLEGRILYATASVEISGGAINVGAARIVTVDTEAGAGADFLDTINGGVEGQIIILKALNGSARSPILNLGVGNVRGGSSFSLNGDNDRWTAIFDGTNWVELSRSDGA